MKFRVGDIITGTKEADRRYSITNSYGTYEVILAYDDEFVRVRIVKHIDLLKVGSEFDVLSKYFVYAKDFVHWDGIFDNAFNKKTFHIENGVPVVNNVGKDSLCYKQLCAEYKEFLKKEKEKKVCGIEN